MAKVAPDGAQYVVAAAVVERTEEQPYSATRFLRLQMPSSSRLSEFEICKALNC